VTVRKINHEPTLRVELPVSVWRRVKYSANYQAEKLSDWTIVNLLSDVFDAAGELTAADLDR
jgi:hypothetical protein